MTLDEKIKETLHKKQLTNDMKQKMWKNIESEISVKKKHNKFTYFVSAAAAAAILFLGTQSNIGQAAFSNIRDLFAPEKTVHMTMEGTDEKINSALVEDDTTSFVIYIDKDRYKSVVENGVTKITPSVPLDDKYPNVSMTIKEVKNVKPEKAIDNMKKELKEFSTFRVEKVNSPIHSTMITASNGNEWDSVVVKYYILSNGKNGSFIIKQEYFLEASEGHGARMDQMVKEFKIIK